MVNTMTKIIKAGPIALLAMAGTANATQVFDLEGFGATSRSMGGTSSAHFIGNAGLVSNPATLSMMDSNSQLEVGLDLITTDISTSSVSSGDSADSQRSGKNRGPYFAPQLSFVSQKNQWTFGAGIYANGGLGTEFGTDSFLSKTENGTQTSFDNSSRLLVLRAPVGFSYEMTPKLTVGASADLVWTSLNLELLLPASQVGALAAGGHLTGDLVAPLAGFVGTGGAAHFSLTKDTPTGGAVDAIGLGGRLGLTYQLSDQTTLGAAYNLKTRVGDLKGSAVLSGISSTGAILPIAGDIRIQDFEMPASLTVGMAHTFNDQWLVTADFKRVYWSDVMENIDVAFESSTGGNVNIELPHNYSDISVFSVGTAYQYSPDLTLRAGFSYAEQALDNRHALPIIPAYLKKHLTLGGEYRITPDSSINLALSFGLKETLSTPSYLAGTEQLSQSHSQINAVVSYTKRF